MKEISICKEFKIYADKMIAKRGLKGKGQQLGMSDYEYAFRYEGLKFIYEPSDRHFQNPVCVFGATIGDIMDLDPENNFQIAVEKAVNKAVAKGYIKVYPVKGYRYCDKQYIVFTEKGIQEFVKYYGKKGQ